MSDWDLAIAPRSKSPSTDILRDEVGFRWVEGGNVAAAEIRLRGQGRDDRYAENASVMKK